MLRYYLPCCRGGKMLLTAEAALRLRVTPGWLLELSQLRLLSSHLMITSSVLLLIMFVPLTQMVIWINVAFYF